jgi:chromosome segregation ATPase
MDQAVSSLEVLPDWCRRNDGFSQALGEAAIRIDGIEQVLARQNEIMEALAYRQGQSQARMEKLLSRLVEQQEAQQEIARGGHLQLDRLHGEAIENRRQLEGILVSAASTERGVRLIAERIETFETVAKDLSPSVMQFSERLQTITNTLLAVAAWQERSEGQQATLGRNLVAELEKLREDIGTIGAGSHDLKQVIDATSSKFAEQIARIGSGIADMARSQGQTRAAFEDIGTQLLSLHRDSSSVLQATTTDVAEILEHLSRFEPEFRSRSDEFSRELHGLIKVQTLTAERIESGNHAIDQMTHRLGEGLDALGTDTARLVGTLGEEGPYLSTVQAGLNSFVGVAEKLELVLGVLSEIRASTRSIAAIETALARMEQGDKTTGALNEMVTVALQELVSSVNAQENALETLAENAMVGEDERRKEVAAFSDLRAELERLRAHLERQAEREIAEVRKLGSALEAVSDMAATSRLGLISQEDTGRSLASLLEQVADIRSLDRSMLDTARASREDMSRLVSALDLFAENDRSRSALLERMTSIVAELRVERQREDTKDAEVRTDYERLRKSLSGIEGTLGLFMKRLERYLGRDDKE